MNVLENKSNADLVTMRVEIQQEITAHLLEIAHCKSFLEEIRDELVRRLRTGG